MYIYLNWLAALLPSTIQLHEIVWGRPESMVKRLAGKRFHIRFHPRPTISTTSSFFAVLSVPLFDQGGQIWRLLWKPYCKRWFWDNLLTWQWVYSIEVKTSGSWAGPNVTINNIEKIMEHTPINRNCWGMFPCNWNNWMATVNRSKSKCGIYLYSRVGMEWFC